MDLLDGRAEVPAPPLLVAIVDHGRRGAGGVETSTSPSPPPPAPSANWRASPTCRLVRMPRGMRATYGEALAEHARAVIAEMRRAGNTHRAARQGRGGNGGPARRSRRTNVLLLPRRRPARAGTAPGHRRRTGGTPDVLHPALLAGELDVIVGRWDRPREGDGASGGCTGNASGSPSGPATPFGDLRRHAHGHPRLPVDPPGRTDRPAPGRSSAPPFADLAPFADRVEVSSILTMRALLLQTDMVALLPELVLRADEHPPLCRSNSPRWGARWAPRRRRTALRTSGPAGPAAPPRPRSGPAARDPLRAAGRPGGDLPGLSHRTHEVMDAFSASGADLVV